MLRLPIVIRRELRELLISYGVDMNEKSEKRWQKIRKLVIEYALSYSPPRVENMRKDIAKSAKSAGNKKVGGENDGFYSYPESPYDYDPRKKK